MAAAASALQAANDVSTSTLQHLQQLAAMALPLAGGGGSADVSPNVTARLTSPALDPQQQQIHQQQQQQLHVRYLQQQRQRQLHLQQEQEQESHPLQQSHQASPPRAFQQQYYELHPLP